MLTKPMSASSSASSASKNTSTKTVAKVAVKEEKKNKQVQKTEEEVSQAVDRVNHDVSVNQLNDLCDNAFNVGMNPTDLVPSRIRLELIDVVENKKFAPEYETKNVKKVTVPNFFSAVSEIIDIESLLPSQYKADGTLNERRDAKIEAIKLGQKTIDVDNRTKLVIPYGDVSFSSEAHVRFEELLKTLLKKLYKEFVNNIRATLSEEDKKLVEAEARRLLKPKVKKEGEEETEEKAALDQRKIQFNINHLMDVIEDTNQAFCKYVAGTELGKVIREYFDDRTVILEIQANNRAERAREISEKKKLDEAKTAKKRSERGSKKTPKSALPKVTPAEITVIADEDALEFGDVVIAGKRTAPTAAQSECVRILEIYRKHNKLVSLTNSIIKLIEKTREETAKFTDVQFKQYVSENIPDVHFRSLRKMFEPKEISTDKTKKSSCLADESCLNDADKIFGRKLFEVRSEIKKYDQEIGSYAPVFALIERHLNAPEFTDKLYKDKSRKRHQLIVSANVRANLTALKEMTEEARKAIYEKCSSYGPLGIVKGPKKFDEALLENIVSVQKEVEKDYITTQSAEPKSVVLRSRRFVFPAKSEKKEKEWLGYLKLGSVVNAIQEECLEESFLTMPYSKRTISTVQSFKDVIAGMGNVITKATLDYIGSALIIDGARLISANHVSAAFSFITSNFFGVPLARIEDIKFE